MIRSAAKRLQAINRAENTKVLRLTAERKLGKAIPMRPSNHYDRAHAI
jgi:hypothetical protein